MVVILPLAAFGLESEGNTPDKLYRRPNARYRDRASESEQLHTIPRGWQNTIRHRNNRLAGIGLQRKAILLTKRRINFERWRNC